MPLNLWVDWITIFKITNNLASWPPCREQHPALSWCEAGLVFYCLPVVRLPANIESFIPGFFFDVSLIVPVCFLLAELVEFNDVLKLALTVSKGVILLS